MSYNDELNELKNEILTDILLQKEMSNRENLLYKKWLNLNTIKMNDYDIENMIMNKEDIIKMINSDDNDVELKLMVSREDKELWQFLRNVLCLMENNHYVGRQLKYILFINGKIGGILAVTSDVCAMSARDKYIGWSFQMKTKGRKLQNILNGVVIIPTQPFGFFCTGGKLISLLMLSKQIRQDYERIYKDKLAGIITTSLFGTYSQYSGMNKYIKPIGESTGKRGIALKKENILKVRKFLNQYDKERYDKLNNASSGKLGILEYFYRKYGIVKELKERNINTEMEHKRGTFFLQIYKNSLSYLRGEITDDELIERDYDFNPDVNGIFNYWKNKYCIKRYENVKDIEKGLFIVSNSETFEEFKLKYM